MFTYCFYLFIIDMSQSYLIVIQISRSNNKKEEEIN